MSSAESVSMPIYVHDPSQPRAPGRNSTARITVTNQNYLFITKPDDDQHYDLVLTVSEPMSLEMLELADYKADEFMRRMIMACNLVMKQIAFSQSSSNPNHAKINRKRPPQGTSKIEVTPTGKKLTIKGSLSLSASVSVIVNYTGIELDELRALDTLQKIHKVFDASSNPPLEMTNLQKSLDRYLEGTQSTDEYSSFPSLFASLEQAINYDGSRDEGLEFDKKTRNVLPNRQWWPIDKLRRANNRLKHADTEKQRASYLDRAELTKCIRYLRPIAAEVILHRLSQV